VAPGTGNHVVCYCKDCQAFAAFLGSPGTVDDAGGTPIFQMPRAQIRITEGLDQLRCVRLSEKGLYRWYAGCCRTAIGNTLGAGLPFIGLILACLDCPERERDALLGPPVRIHAREARGKAPNGSHAKVPLSFVLRAAPKFVKWLALRKGSPSPFFDAKGAPPAPPQILTKDARDALR
jgi:hypothetical protein